MSEGSNPSPPSNPSGRRVITAERMQAVSAPEPARRITKEVLREGAVETLLNGFGILRDLVADFRASDSFFKYKALVLTLWLALCVTSIGVACPGGGVSNSIAARLVIAGDSKRPVFMVKNDSDSKWTEVEIIVNGQWRTTATEVGPNGDITIVSRQLANGSGEAAPADLQVTDLHVRTAEGEAELMRRGHTLQQ